MLAVMCFCSFVVHLLVCSCEEKDLGWPVFDSVTMEGICLVMTEGICFFCDCSSIQDSLMWKKDKFVYKKQNGNSVFVVVRFAAVLLLCCCCCCVAAVLVLRQ